MRLLTVLLFCVAVQADERATVERLHERIVAAKPSALAAYKMTIPGTTVSIDMVPIPGGEFRMGTPASEPGRKADEGPQHRVRIEPFWMQRFEVTWDQYRLFMSAKQAGELDHKDEVVDAISRPTRPYVEMSFGMGIEGYPAISMTQHAANKFAEWLSARTGQFYRLPTEAEWEYACRAGTSTAYYFGDDPKQLGDYAWYSANSDSKYQKVGTKKPNPWGLYDMLGNVMEWTLDQYDANFYAKSQPWNRATRPYPQVVRGGSWNDDAAQLRCGARMGSDASWKQQDPQLPKSIWYHTDAQWLGFRLVRPVKVPSAEEMYRYWNSGVEKEETASLRLQRFEAAQPHMGTLFTITLYAPNSETAQAAFDEAFARIHQLDGKLSDYQPESELMQLCRRAYRAPTEVSSDLFRVLAKAQQLSRDTDGAFDVTVGPLSRLWREARKTKTPPSPEAIARARQQTGYKNLILDSARNTVELRLPDMQLDLGAIAKGYAADEALRVLRAHGIASALVAASGDLAIGDPPPGKAGWRVGIELPGASPMTLHNIAISTSGDTEQFLELHGIRYSHIIDPKTGMALTRRAGSSVIAPNGIDADSYATALCVLAAQRGIVYAAAWSERCMPGSTARIVLESETRQTGSRSSPRTIGY